MDDSFKKMSEEFKVSYDKSFWKEAQAQLENDSLDSAFRVAADQSASMAGFAQASELLGDAFMDDAFKDAAAQTSVAYDSAYWQQMEASMPELQMDEAFFAASKETKASYNPIYWGAANSALEKEGLHYEYQSAYWNEAKTLLDKEDRKVFFTKWAAVAVLLLLISSLGIGVNINDVYTNTHRAGHGSSDAANLHELNATDRNQSDELVAINNDNETDFQEANPRISAEELNNIGEDVANDITPNSSVPNNTENSVVNNVTPERDNQPENNESPSETDNEGVNDIEIVETNVNNGSAELEYAINPQDENAELTQSNTDNLDENRGNTEPGIADETALLEEINAIDNFNKINTVVTPIDMTSEVGMPSTSLMEITKQKLKQNHSFSVIAGAGFGNGYGSQDFQRTNRFYGGLEYLTKGFGKLRKFELGGSVAVDHSKHNDLLLEDYTKDYYRTPTLDENGKLVWSTRYGSVLKVTDIYTVNTSLLINYRINPKHKIKFGVGIDTYLNTQNNLINRVGENSVIVNNDFERYEGFRNTDLRFSLGYEYQISNRFGVQLNANYGIFDRTTDRFDGGLVYDNEMSMTLGLKYNIFRVAE